MNHLAVIRGLLFLALLLFANSITASAQADTIYRLPVGTRIHLKMDVEVSSKFSSVNDTFTATVSRPVTKRDVIVLPVGTVFEGRVTGTSPASAAARDGKLEVVIETIKFDHDIKRQIEGRPVSGFGRSSSSAPGVIAVVGGAAAGVLVGALTGSPAGAVLGAAVGAGAGTGVVLARKGKEARIGKDEEFEIELKKEVVLPVVDY